MVVVLLTYGGQKGYGTTLVVTTFAGLPPIMDDCEVSSTPRTWVHDDDCVPLFLSRVTEVVGYFMKSTVVGNIVTLVVRCSWSLRGHVVQGLKFLGFFPICHLTM